MLGNDGTEVLLDRVFFILDLVDAVKGNLKFVFKEVVLFLHLTKKGTVI